MYKLVTAPASSALSLADGKAFLEITKSNQDTIIQQMIDGCVLQAQAYACCQFVNASWMLQVECMPGSGGYVQLGKGIVSSITSVKYNDTTGTEQTLSNTKYQLDNVTGRVIFLDSAPALSSTFPYVRITYVAGFGADESAVPANIKDALKLALRDAYDNRTDERQPLPKASERILNVYRYKYYQY